MLDIKTLENWLKEAIYEIKNLADAPKYKDYIMFLIFLKRLSDVFDEEIEKLAEEFGDKKTAEAFVEQDHTLMWFYIPKQARWQEIIKQNKEIGEFLTNAIKAIVKENPKLQGVIDIKDFNETIAGKRIISDELLKILINILNKYKLGLKDVELDILGRVYEYLLRKFVKGSGQSTGEFYTPKEVAILMANIIDPKEGESVYDPCLGSGGLFINMFLKFKEKYGDNLKIKSLQFYGQEFLQSAYIMAKMNSFIHRMEANIALGDTMNKPAFKNKDGSLMKFDIIIANPVWNQVFDQSTYKNDSYNRFIYGYPPNNSADWGWVQHMFASLKDKGRMAVVLDAGAVSRGSGNKGLNRERDIRKAFIENDFIEAVLLLPENLFYNTTSTGIILIINKDKKHKDKILLINASKLFKKGKPKNYLPDSTIKQITDIYLNFNEEEGISKIVTKEELIKNDYNLIPSRYVSINNEDTTLPLDEAVSLFKKTKEEQEQAEEKLKDILKQLGFEI